MYPTSGSSKRLLQTFLALSLLSGFLILLLSGSGLHYLLEKHLLQNSRSQAISVGRALLEQERAVLLGGLTLTQTFLSTDELHEFGERMVRTMALLDVIKVKLFARDASIIYSSDPSLTGSYENTNATLAEVLEKGVVIAEIEQKEYIRALAGKHLYDREVAEIYLPLRNDEGVIFGGFELYIDVTDKGQSIDGFIANALLLIALILFMTFSLFYLLMRKGVVQLKGCNDGLDPLTEVFNRQSVLKQADELFHHIIINQPARPKLGMGLLLAQIDGFQAVNDMYGHKIGDNILREMAERLKKLIPEEAIVGRYSGEEFIILLPHTSRSLSTEIAKGINQQLQMFPFKLGAKQQYITLSIGHTYIDGDEPNLHSCIARAHMGQRRAQEGGGATFESGDFSG